MNRRRQLPLVILAVAALPRVAKAAAAAVAHNFFQKNSYFMGENLNKNYIIFAILILATVAGLAAFLFFKMPAYQKLPSPQKARELFSKGYEESAKKDADSAIRAFEEVKKITPDQNIAAFAKLEIAQNNFLKFNQENIRLAIESAKEIIANETIRQSLRAWSVNRLLDFYLTNRDPKIFQMIFDDDKYKLFAISDDKKLAVRKLAEYSNGIFPTSHAKLRIAMWYSGELLDNKNLDGKTKKEYGDMIADLVKEAERLFNAEVQRGSHPVEISKANFYHFKAFNLAALSLAGLNKPDEKNLFEQAFLDALRLNKPKNGQEDIRLKELLAYTDFYYGAFLYEIFGKLRITEAQGHANAVAENVKNHPNPELHPFYSFKTAERTRDPAERDHNYRFFLELASISDPFKNLLIQSGWALK